MAILFSIDQIYATLEICGVTQHTNTLITKSNYVINFQVNHYKNALTIHIKVATLH